MRSRFPKSRPHSNDIGYFGTLRLPAKERRQGTLSGNNKKGPFMAVAEVVI